MVSKTTPVNMQSEQLDTFGGRLVAERQRLKLKQVDVCVMGGVSKTTQIKYEANDRKPDAEYLARLSGYGFDVLYMLTGERSEIALSPELQNLVDAYLDASTELKKAALAVLLSPWLKNLPAAKDIPGFARYEMKGEGDTRYLNWVGAGRKAREGGQTNISGSIGQVVQGDMKGSVHLGDLTSSFKKTD